MDGGDLDEERSSHIFHEIGIDDTYRSSDCNHANPATEITGGDLDDGRIRETTINYSTGEIDPLVDSKRRVGDSHCGDTVCSIRSNDWPDGENGNLGGELDETPEKSNLPDNRSDTELGADCVGVGEGVIRQNAHVGKPVGKRQIAQQNQSHSRTEWFRYELDFRPLKTGYNVLIRKRLRWSDTRYSRLVLKRFCPQMTKVIVGQISVGKFSAAGVAALQSGGIDYGFIKALQERIGKGNGKRYAELTEFERSLLARIESSLRSGN